MAEIKLFNRWSSEGIVITDQGIEPYISLKPVLVPKTGARYAGNKFHKSRTNIVERLINKVMIPGHKAKKHKVTSYHCTGKANTAYKIVESALASIEKRTGKNPILVYAKAVENAAPREEIISIEYGGARYPKAVECSPQRRVDQALKHMVQGAHAKSFNSKKHIAEALADEILAASNCSQSSNAIQKKLELERQADSSR